MASNPSAEPVAQSVYFPTDLLLAWQKSGEFDAALVLSFLDQVGLTPASLGRPVVLPAHFLLELGAALRLLFWECQGSTAYVQAGLPTAREALCRAFTMATFNAKSEERVPTPLWEQVTAYANRQVAWHGLAELNAEIFVDFGDDEELLEAMAEFIWNNRHALDDANPS